MTSRLRKLHVGLVLESFDLDAGGAERSAAQIATELVQRGHQVTILAGSCPDCDQLPQVAIRSLAEKRSASAYRLIKFVRWVRTCLVEGAFDVTLSMTTAVPGNLLQPRGGTVRETLERNVVVQRGMLSREFKRVAIRVSPKHQIQLWLEKRTFTDPSVSKVVAISTYVVDQFQRHYKLDPKKIELLANAAVTSPATDLQRQKWRRQVRSAFSVPDHALVYLFIAQNPKLKGFSPLLAAMRRVKNNQPILMLAGNFGYAEHLQVNRAGLRDRVRFVRKTRMVDALYAAVDVTVQPTFYDPASKVVIESLMMGTPVISTIFNGSSTLIKPDDGPPRGRVIEDPADVDALAEAMVQLADPTERRRCSEATEGLDRLLCMSRHVDSLEQLLQEAAG